MTDFEFISAVEAIIDPIVAKFETKPECWIHGWDESVPFCYDCAVKQVEELSKESPSEEFIVDGGYRSEGDSQAFCDTCGDALNNSFTTYACESELDHFEENGFDVTSPSDCYSLSNILGAEGCGDSDLWERIQALGLKIIADASALTAPA